MEHKIITIAAIVFALVFVLILAVMMGTITNKANSANTQLADTLSMSSDTGVEEYENGSFTGEAVINAIKNVKTIGGDAKIKITVKTAADTSGTSYGYTDPSGKPNEIVGYTAPAPTDPKYISTTATFNSTVNKSANGIPQEIVFEQVA